MAMNHLVLGFAILVLGIVTESSAHNGRSYPQYVYPNYKQQKPYQPHQGYQNNQAFELPPGILPSDVAWVCKSTSNDEMMLIATKDGAAPNPGGNNGQGQWQQPTYPQVNPNQPTYPQVNPNQPTYPQVNPNQPTYPQVNPNQPTYPQVDPNYPTQPTQNPQQPTQAPPNTNGEGIIDIRFGEK